MAERTLGPRLSPGLGLFGQRTDLALSARGGEAVARSLAVALASLACALGMGGACAQPGEAPSAPRVDAQVRSVESGGQWTSPTGNGFSRIVIVDQGFEHVHSQVWLEWLIGDEKGGSRRVSRVLVKELSSGFAIVAIGDRSNAFLRNRVRLRVTHTYSPDHRDAVIVVGRPGRYQLIDPAPR